ncbi:MAG TPA: helix-turn-helix domain-containing protein, partial [Planctomycetota bacterium]|nr:helix-turn-helix domain-containing protein [Planctomycetota bacterium]
GATAFAARVGCGATKLTDLCRRHFHATPADVVVAARLAFARDRLATTRSSVLDVGLDAGFASSSAFHDNFRAHSGTTPREYRRLLQNRSFALTLPAGFPVADCLHWLSRTPDSACERRIGDTLHLALLLDGRPAVLSLQFTAALLRCRVQTVRAPSPLAMRSAHATVVRLLNLAGDPRPARAVLAADARLLPLLRRRPGLRVFQHQSPFACLLWAILGQQVHLRLAAALRAAVVRAAGQPIGDLIAHPDAAAVAALDAAELRAMHCSRQKTDCLLAAAAAVADGTLDFTTLAAGSAASAASRLQALPGIGPWSSQYVLLRGLGFADALPAGDAALALAMQQLFALPQRPDAAVQQRLAAPFAPHRGLFTFHLWHALADTAVPDSGARIRKNARPRATTIIAS